MEGSLYIYVPQNFLFKGTALQILIYAYLCNHHHHQDPKQCHRSNNAAAPCSQALPCTPTLAATDVLFASIVLTFQDYLTNGIVQRVAFQVWLLSLSVTQVRLICAVECIIDLFLFMV